MALVAEAKTTRGIESFIVKDVMGEESSLDVVVLLN